MVTCEIYFFISFSLIVFVLNLICSHSVISDSVSEHGLWMIKPLKWGTTFCLPFIQVPTIYNTKYLQNLEMVIDPSTVASCLRFCCRLMYA